MGFINRQLVRIKLSMGLIRIREVLVNPIVGEEVIDGVHRDLNDAEKNTYGKLLDLHIYSDDDINELSPFKVYGMFALSGDTKFRFRWKESHIGLVGGSGEAPYACLLGTNLGYLPKRFRCGALANLRSAAITYFGNQEKMKTIV